MANIGIIGHGIVGKAVEHGFKENNKILAHDKYQNLSSLKEVVENSEFIFICLPTPFKEKESRIDLAIIDENLDEIAKYAKNTNKIIIIKSTITPGTTERCIKKYPECNFCYNPEFLTEVNFLNDFASIDRVVIGAEKEEIKQRVSNLYKERFPNAKIFLTNPTTAEMVKYMANTFLATKVIFANEIYSLCEKLGINYDEMKQIAVSDKRITDSHLNITSEKGFGGKCFPKDLIALIGLFKELKVDCSLLESVWKKNLEIRKDYDWNEIPFVKT